MSEKMNEEVDSKYDWGIRQVQLKETTSVSRAYAFANGPIGWMGLINYATLVPMGFNASNLAGFGVRLGALVCEVLFLIILMVSVGRLFQAVVPFDLIYEWFLGLFIVEFICVFPYYGFCWVKKQQTIVMNVWQMQLRRPDGSSVGWLRAGLRYGLVWFFGCCFFLPIILGIFLGMFSGFSWFFIVIGVSPYWWVTLDREKLFLHDRLSGTRIMVIASSDKGLLTEGVTK